VDTIAAIGTALGEGGIGIVRISGPRSEQIINELFIPSKPENWKRKESHRLYLGHFRKGGEKKVIIDEVLVTIMKAPQSYTGENMAEIHCHGGALIMKTILEEVLATGAVLAEPGEFTKRAFLNGKLDLTKAEATIDLIRASSEAGLKIAASQLEGNLAKKITVLQEQLLKILAFLEATIDFPEEELPGLADKEIEAGLKSLIASLEELAEGFKQGQIIREGLKTVIFGKPNVGKSSLLNALLGRERAIVTDIPGTTRDLIMETIYLEGIPVKLIDTAGVRLTEDLIEIIGVEKTKETLKEAELAFLVLDGGAELGENDFLVFELAKELDIPFLILLNKVDLRDQVLKKGQLETVFAGVNILEISALKGYGLSELGEEIKKLFDLNKLNFRESPLLTKMRHFESVKKSLKHLTEALDALQQGYPEDFLIIDLKAGYDYLAEIVGKDADEEVLNKIFADFCIGK